ncbi:MAG: hypothetical protein L3K08_06980, partial [Thermoplasmata archaeon]|nr:hypothetical protein [Thermoplasmata archaeon]
MFSKLERTARSTRRFTTLPRWVALLAIILALVGVWGISTPIAAHPPTTRSEIAASPAAAESVSVSPGSWSLVAGDSVVFAAVVVGVPDDCVLSSVVFSWSLPGESEFAGMVNASEGPSVRFSASATASGAVVVAVAATGAIDCSSTLDPLSAGGSATVGITPEERVSNFAANPDPVVPGGQVVLQW